MLLTSNIGIDTNGHHHHTWNSRVFLWTFHVTHTRRTHQFTIATQHMLKHQTYDHNCKANDLRNEFIFLFVDGSIHPKKMTGNCIIARSA
jgi:hypothetical protein